MISKDFSTKLREELGFPKDEEDNIYDIYGDSHTSSLIIGYHHAMEKGLLEKYESVLFINSGSGLSTGCAMYIL